MKITVKLWGMSEIMRAFTGNREVQVEFHGQEVKDLIFQLFSDIDPRKKGFIFDDNNEISSELTIILNGRVVSEANRFNRRLRGGDFIELFLVPG